MRAILLASAWVSGPLSGSADPIRFADVTAELGIDFTHRNGIGAEKYLPETYGSGIAWFDSDGDGDFDLYLVNSGNLVEGRGDSWNRLYRNDGARFREVTREAGLSGSAYGMGVAAADYDNDGDQDLYLANWGPDQLLRNDGSTFTGVPLGSGVGQAGWSSSAVFVDGDNDGYLDLYVTSYVAFDIASTPGAGGATWDCGSTATRASSHRRGTGIWSTTARAALRKKASSREWMIPATASEPSAVISTATATRTSTSPTT